jgi:uncharacterized protein (UPF0333 family)
MFVWAVLASSIAGYFYLQNTMNSEQIAENQQSINTMSTAYNEAMAKYNELLSDYSVLQGNYSFSVNTNFTLLTSSFLNLLNKVKGNFSSLLTDQKDLNETHYALQSKSQTFLLRGNVTRAEFGELLDECYEFLNLLAIRELSKTISEITTLTVNICIDYGNGTVEWHNKTAIPAGSSLFQLTQKVAPINFTYDALMKPGHIRITSINNKTEYTHTEPVYSEGAAWLWYYWDDNKQEWVFGPVGCDAWMLKDGGIYKWSFESWHWPP